MEWRAIWSSVVLRGVNACAWLAQVCDYLNVECDCEGVT